MNEKISIDIPRSIVYTDTMENMPTDICLILVKNGFSKEVNEILSLEDAQKDESRYYAEAEKRFTPKHTKEDLLKIFPQGRWITRPKQHTHKRSLSSVYAVPIERIVSDHTRGKKGKYNCPFHNETAPSISILKRKNTFKCFGCQVGGNGVEFVKRFYSLTPKEAIDFISRRYL